MGLLCLGSQSPGSHTQQEHLEVQYPQGSFHQDKNRSPEESYDLVKSPITEKENNLMDSSVNLVTAYPTVCRGKVMNVLQRAESMKKQKSKKKKTIAKSADKLLFKPITDEASSPPRKKSKNKNIMIKTKDDISDNVAVNNEVEVDHGLCGHHKSQQWLDFKHEDDIKQVKHDFAKKHSDGYSGFLYGETCSGDGCHWPCGPKGITDKNTKWMSIWFCVMCKRDEDIDDPTIWCNLCKVQKDVQVGGVGSGCRSSRSRRSG